MTLNHKGSARIFTDTLENLEKIRAIILRIDEFEFDYLPDDLIAIFQGNFNNLTYNGKFEIDVDLLQKECLKEGVPCGIVVGKSQYEYDDYPSLDCSTNESIQLAIKQFYLTGFWNREKVLNFYGLDYINNPAHTAEKEE